MNFRLTIIMVIVLALAASVYLIVAKNSSVAPAAITASSLYSPKPTGVKTITYARNGSDELKFVKDGDQWKMTFPVQAAADAAQVGSIASTLETMGYQQKFAPEATGNHSPEATGTGKPHDIIKFTDDANHEYTLYIGKHGHTGVFATLNTDKTIYVLSANPVESLDQPPERFRNMDIKQIDTNKIVGVSLQSKDPWTLSKSADKWVINAPVSARANASAVSDLLKELQDIRAQNFSTLTKKETGLDPPVASITALVQDTPLTVSPATTSGPASQPAGPPPTKVILELGYPTDITIDKASSPVYASLAGSNDVFVLRNDAFKKLNRELKDIRDPSVTPAPVTNATDVTVSTDGAVSVSLSKKDSKWTLASGTAPLPADVFAVNDYLGLIRELKAITFVDNVGDLKSIGLDPPHLKIDLALPDRAEHEVILIGKTEPDVNGGKITSVMRQGEATVFHIPAADADRLAASPLTMRDRTIEQLIGDRIRTIAIAGPSATSGLPTPTTTPATMPATGPATSPATTIAATAPAPLTPGVMLERVGTRWTVKSNGKDSPADDSKISALLSEFTPLTASKYLADNITVSGTPSLTVTVTLVEPTLVPPPAATVPAAPLPATTPATGPATATTPAKPPTLAEVLPDQGIMGPDPGKTITRTLLLYKTEADKKITWKAVWENQTPPPAWAFEPTAALIEQLTKEVFIPTAPPPRAPTPPGGDLGFPPGGGF